MNEIAEMGLRVGLSIAGCLLLVGLHIGVDWVRDAMARRGVPDFDRDLNAREIAWLETAEGRLERAGHAAESYRPRIWMIIWIELAAMVGCGVAAVMLLPGLHTALVNLAYPTPASAVIVEAGSEGWLIALGIWLGIAGICSLAQLYLHKSHEEFRTSSGLLFNMTCFDTESVRLGILSTLIRGICSRRIRVDTPLDITALMERKSARYLKVCLGILAAGAVLLCGLYVKHLGEGKILYADRLELVDLFSGTKDTIHFSSVERADIHCHAHDTMFAKLVLSRHGVELADITIPDGQGNNVANMLAGLSDERISLQVPAESECRQTCIQAFTDTAGQQVFQTVREGDMQRDAAHGLRGRTPL